MMTIDDDDNDFQKVIHHSDETQIATTKTQKITNFHSKSNDK